MLQVYGFGKSEEFLGEFMRSTGTSPLVATKFAPLVRAEVHVQAVHGRESPKRAKL